MIEATCNEENHATSNKTKYKELKKRLKYLVYEGHGFEGDIKEAQAKLLQLSREKSFLLDQLMKHETIILSADESDADSTDYSSSEEKLPQVMDTPVKNTLSSQPAAVPKLTPPSASLPPKQAGKSTARGSGKRYGRGTAAKSAAAVAKLPKLSAKNSVAPKPVSTDTLIVSLPISTIPQGLQQLQGVKASKPTVPSLPLLPSSGIEPAAVPVSSAQKIKDISSSSSSLSSDSSSSGSSSSSESVSQSSDSSDSEAEGMDTGDVPTLPQMVDNSPAIQVGSKVVQPKAIPSPIKIMAPSQLTSLTLVSPPFLSPLTSPAEKQPAISVGSNSVGKQQTVSLGFVPLAPPLTSSSSRVFASLNKPSGLGAFHVVSQPAPVKSQQQHQPSKNDDTRQQKEPR